MVNNKTLLKRLASMVPLILIGLTLWTVWQFCAGDIGHPMGFLASFAVDQHEFNVFESFASVPTLEKQGLMAIFLWPVYYATGIILYLMAGVLAMQAAEYLLYGVDVGFRAAWDERQAALKAQAQAEEVHAKRFARLKKRVAENANATDTPAGSQGWSVGAIAFGVFLGWLLFH